MPGCGPVFHIEDEKTLRKAFLVDVLWRSSVPEQAGPWQSKTYLTLLIGCGKVEKPVDELWKRSRTAQSSGEQEQVLLQVGPRHVAANSSTCPAALSERLSILDVTGQPRFSVAARIRPRTNLLLSPEIRDLRDH